MYKIEKIRGLRAARCFIFSLLIAGCAGTPKTSSPPSWYYRTSDAFPEDRYVAAVGSGVDRESAEKSALGALISVFGQSVQGEMTASYKYSEAVSEGLIDLRENSDIDSAVKTSFAMDTLVGAEIKDRWFDGVTHYAVAVMERDRGSVLYRRLISSNDEMIRRLVDIPPEDLETFDAFIRYGLAATIADANQMFTNVLSVLRPAAALTETSSGDAFRLKARDTAAKIPIMVKLDNDPQGRISAAFGEVLTGMGLRTGGANPRYILDAALTLEEVDLPQNQNKFVRYTLNAKLRDVQSAQVLFEYKAGGREGHTNIPEARNRALKALETKISEDFTAEFQAKLGRLAH